MNTAFWRGKRVFVTGHTGFKGSWLSLWLQSKGANLRGFALDAASTPNLYTIARVDDGMASVRGDIRDDGALRRALVAFRPEIVFHLAAQARVRRSYDEPALTYATNVMGTVNLLEAVRLSGDVRAVVHVTSGQCYENRDWAWGYREDEAMGGHDPCSSSRGCAELVAAAYRRSFLHDGTAIATARCGNLIGGGDWSAERLLPDLLKAFAAGDTARVRHPDAVRPWQHVLEPLAGCLQLAERLCSDGQAAAEGWNFGAADDDTKPVRWLADRLATLWGTGARWQPQPPAAGSAPHEAVRLKLDCSKARQRLGWQPRWQLNETLERLVHWQRRWLSGADMRAHCLADIREHGEAIHLRGVQPIPFRNPAAGADPALSRSV